MRIIKYPLMRGKGSVAAVPGADDVAGHDPEVIHSARTQAGDDRVDVLVTVARPRLVGCSGSVVGGSSILKVHGRAQPVWINASVECG